MSKTLEEGKKTILDPKYLYTPAKSRDATNPRINLAHDEIQEPQLPYNDIEANSILLDKQKEVDNTLLQSIIPIPPSHQGSPMATPTVPNLYNNETRISILIKSLLNTPSSKLTGPEL